jgi:hypothetical protein
MPPKEDVEFAFRCIFVRKPIDLKIHAKKLDVSLALILAIDLLFLFA